jgi:hypothetical protein
LTGLPVVATVPLNHKRPQLLNLKAFDQNEEIVDFAADETDEDYLIEFMNSKNQTVYSKY